MVFTPDAQTQTLAPFRLSPYFRTRIWGFQNLAPWFDFKTSGEPIGEVWLTGDKCKAETGAWAGHSLRQLTAEQGEVLLGPGRAGEEFPLLVKVLFPKEKLSVQVHPDDALARQYGEPRGKTECWYTLDAEPGAAVALGLKPGVTPEQVRKAIDSATLEELMEYVPLSKGDMIFVDAGTVHAILPGAVILETQQNSDLTYRLYDYGRPRELHLDRSFAAMRVATRAGKVTPQPEGDRSTLIDAPYFRVERFRLEGTLGSEALRRQAEPQLQLLFVADGRLTVRGAGFDSFTLDKCQLAVAPALSPAFELHADKPVELIRMVPR